ncbi:biotin/lipoyl-binding carrier protein [Novosphingobium sp. ERN07]|nr:biotin/lipoyl-binding carrier protein [Novosphingobium sp. ERN07]
MAVEVRSEITGNVWKVIVANGVAVAVGDVIAILESMKMEIPVEATVSGICELRVAEGDAIQEGDLVAVIA